MGHDLSATVPPGQKPGLNKLFLNIKKSKFKAKKIKYLGLILIIKRVEIDLDKVKTILE